MKKTIIVSILILICSLLLVILYIFSKNKTSPMVPLVQVETPNNSCQKDSDCVLAKPNEWLACDHGPCKKDYEEKGYISINKNWHQEKTKHCTNKASVCQPEDLFLSSNSFIAKCIRNQCQKTTDAFESYSPPKIPRKDIYTIFLLGDSMTLALGPHGGTFNTFLHELYKGTGRKFQIDNYASGSTNILTLNKQMTNQTTYWDSTFDPLLTRDFDLILVESFAYNPLSQFGPEEGLKKHSEALDGLMKNLTVLRPNSAVVFVATISPNKENFARIVNPDRTPEARSKEAEERILYLKNHISYAKSHNIPLVNIFEKSQTLGGDGELSFINPDDYIHPSFKGVDFIGQEIANFIYTNEILPR